MKIKETLFSTELEITPEEIERLTDFYDLTWYQMIFDLFNKISK